MTPKGDEGGIEKNSKKTRTRFTFLIDKKNTGLKKPNSNKKKKSLFYKFSMSSLLIFSLLLLYFIVLVSDKPRSIDYLTARINHFLKNNINEHSSVEKSWIKFTRYGVLNVTLENFQTRYDISWDKEREEWQDYQIPKIELEFSVLNLLTLNRYPSRVRIIDSVLNLNQILEINDSGVDGEPNGNDSLFNEIVSFLVNMEILVKKFEIENAKIFFKNFNIYIDSSKLAFSQDEDGLRFRALNKIYFGSGQEDARLTEQVSFQNNCLVNPSNNIRCNILASNLDLGLASPLIENYPKLAFLKGIKGFVDVAINIEANQESINKSSFKIISPKADVDLPSFFAEKMSFDDLSIVGNYNDNLDILNIFDIKAKIANRSVEVADKISDFAMSLLVINLTDPQKRNLQFFIELMKVPTSHLSKYWPSYLSGHDVRDWVLRHIHSGRVDKAYAKFAMVSENGDLRLQAMDSKINFSDFSVNYNNAFPQVESLNGVATFDVDSMKIEIDDGKVLGSKITKGDVSIADFSRGQLKISANTQGNSGDYLKHIDQNNSELNKAIDNFSGDSTGKIEIALPIKDNILLDDVLIDANVRIKEIQSDNINGELVIKTKKSFGSDVFNTDINLKSTQLVFKHLDIIKSPGVDSNLSFKISAKNNETKIEDFTFTKEYFDQDLQKYKSELLKGGARIMNYPLAITDLELVNENFGKNNYELSYSFNPKIMTRNIDLKAKELNLGVVSDWPVAVDNYQSKEFKDPIKNTISVTADTVHLKNNRAAYNLSIKLSCMNYHCISGNFFTNYNNGKTINIVLNSNDGIKSLISGHIHDVGYLADGFGLSNVISGGNFKIDANSSINRDGFATIKGNIESQSKLTVYESERLKNLSRNDLFSKVKDQIFSNDKTNFDNVKISFTFEKENLFIDSLIANNYKVGVTSKGKIDFNNGSYNLKGMIIPGFVINNLFGAGKIPVVGNIISGVLTGGNDESGIFGLSYQYQKNSQQKEADFKTNKVSTFVPTSIKNLFD